VKFGGPNDEALGGHPLYERGLGRYGVYEVFNSSWPAYQVSGESEYANGGYGAVLNGGSIINVPPVGGVVLERR